MMILEKTINEMPNSFTSNEFNKRAIKNGYPAKSLKRKGLANFIRKYADNAYEGSKTWMKKTIQDSKPAVAIMTDEEMIKHLKSKGYKIMRPINDWIEC
jgi:hypothetical protein